MKLKHHPTRLHVFFEQFAPRYPLAFLEIASEFCSMNLTSSVCAQHVQPKAPKDLTSSKCSVFVPERLNSRIRKRFNHVTCPVLYLHPVIHVCWWPTISPAMVESIQMSWSTVWVQLQTLGCFQFSRLEKCYLSPFHPLLPWHAAATACPAIRVCTCAPRLQWFT